MANPIFVNCPKDSWTKIATNVTAGQAHKVLKRPSSYLSTYRLTGESAPTLLSDGVPIFLGSTSEYISSSVGIDVYIYPVSHDGRVRVDV